MLSYRIVSQSQPDDPVAGEVGQGQVFAVDLEALGISPPYDVTLSQGYSVSAVAAGVESNDVAVLYWWESDKVIVYELVTEP